MDLPNSQEGASCDAKLSAPLCDVSGDDEESCELSEEIDPRLLRDEEEPYTSPYAAGRTKPMRRRSHLNPNPGSLDCSNLQIDCLGDGRPTVSPIYPFCIYGFDQVQLEPPLSANAEESVVPAVPEPISSDEGVPMRQDAPQFSPMGAGLTRPFHSNRSSLTPADEPEEEALLPKSLSGVVGAAAPAPPHPRISLIHTSDEERSDPSGCAVVSPSLDHAKRKSGAYGQLSRGAGARAVARRRLSQKSPFRFDSADYFQEASPSLPATKAIEEEAVPSETDSPASLPTAQLASLNLRVVAGPAPLQLPPDVCPSRSPLKSLTELPAPSAPSNAVEAAEEDAEGEEEDIVIHSVPLRNHYGKLIQKKPMKDVLLKRLQKGTRFDSGDYFQKKSEEEGHGRATKAAEEPREAGGTLNGLGHHLTREPKVSSGLSEAHFPTD